MKATAVAENYKAVVAGRLAKGEFVSSILTLTIILKLKRKLKII